MDHITTHRAPSENDSLYHIATPLPIRLAMVVVLGGVLSGVWWLLYSRSDLGALSLVFSAAGLILLFVLIVLKACNTHNWVSFSLSERGVYFPSSITGEFILIPWRFIGIVRPGQFGPNARGLHFEIHQDLSQIPITNTFHVSGNSTTSWVQVKSDLLNRKKLLKKIEMFRAKHSAPAN